jgi:mannosyltransferase OCH1-like enzyme
VRIPRTIHHVWIGPDPVPDHHRPWIESWRRHHPSWEHRLWTEENLPDDPIRPEIFERLRAPVERADILRLEILFRHGGVYADTDLECLGPVDALLEGEQFVAVCLKPGRVTNTFIAAAPGHALLERALRELMPMDVYWSTTARESIKEGAGPPLLRRLVAQYPGVRLLEPPLMFPATPEEHERAVAVHHMARTWHNATALRAAITQAERRIQLATAEMEREQRRHAATRRRLARLEARLERRRAGKGGIRARLGLLRR